MRKNVLGSDGGLTISEYPHSFGATADEQQVLAQLCLEDAGAFRLPVVYLTRDWFTEHCVVDEGELARRLCGVAHVLVESDKDVSRTLKDLCHGKNVYNGGMAVYFPSVSAAAKRFIPYDGMDVEKVMTQMFNSSVSHVDKSALLVKMAVAQKQLAEDAAKRQTEMDAVASDREHTAASYGGNGQGDMTGGAFSSADTAHGSVADGTSPYGRPMPAASAPAPAEKRRFFLSAALDTIRINRDVQNYVEEIIRHLTSEDGTRVTISLEVEAESNNGFSPRPSAPSPRMHGHSARRMQGLRSSRVV